MAKPTYWELLRHPEWQKKRLEVMNRAGFECENCGTKEVTLNVHHRYYTKGAKPWEYPDEAFECLCEPCHADRHQQRAKLATMIAEFESVFTLDELMGFIEGRLFHGGEKKTLSLGGYEWALGTALASAIDDDLYAGWLHTSLFMRSGQTISQIDFADIFFDAIERRESHVAKKAAPMPSDFLLMIG